MEHNAITNVCVTGTTIEDDIYGAYRASSKADALVIGCPTYGRRLPALMYAFLQRVLGLPFQWPLVDKPVALLFICDENYDCKLGKRDSEELSRWKNRVIASITIGTPNMIRHRVHKITKTSTKWLKNFRKSYETRTFS